ncbi:MAG TPA: hypothetical protein VG940_01165 [Gemmatimonadales bacterium]|nr:hypothetical protein [Gemmatimonadales bacterium]
MARFDWDGLSFGPKSEEVHRPHELLEQSFGKSMLIYFGVLGGSLGTSIAGLKFLQIHPLRTLLVLLGVVYLLAGLGWPRSLYLTLRGMRSFRYVSDPLTLRRWMLVIGVLLLAAGLLLPYAQLAMGSRP